MGPVARPSSRHVRRFCLVTTAASAPFWVIGATAQAELIVDGLPLSAGMFVAPAIAVWATGAPGGIPVPVRRKGWPSVVSGGLWASLMPAVLVCSYALTRMAEAHVPVEVGATPASVIALCLVFTISSACEEVGWSRFLTPALMTRASILPVGIGIGIMWAALHVVPYLQADRAWSWIAWQCLFTLAFRVLIVATVADGRRGWWVAVVLHASYDVAWALTPIDGSAYDPRFAAALTAVVAAVLVRHAARAGSAS